MHGQGIFKWIGGEFNKGKYLSVIGIMVKCMVKEKLFSQKEMLKKGYGIMGKKFHNNPINHYHKKYCFNISLKNIHF